MRGKKTSGLFRRRLAAFLAVCMVASNLQGLSLAYGSEEIKPENAKLIQLDVEKLREAAEMAAQDGVLVTPPVTMATASDATPSTAVPFQNPAYELMDVSQLLAEGTAFPDETVVRIFLEPEMYEEEEKTADADSIELINDVQLEEELGDGYELTGNEKLIFYIENQGKEAQGYQIQFGDKVTGIIVAESSKNLLKEYEMGASDENAGPGATEGATEESTGAATEESTEESTEATTEESTEESTEAATEESTEESTEAATEESTEESTEATTEGATEESTEATTEGATEESTEAATEESIEESTEAETSGEESLGDNVDAGNTEEEDGEPEEEEAGEPAVEEGQADPENQTVGFLEKAVQFFTGTMTAYAAETATPSNEAVPTATGSNVIDTTKVEKKSFTNAENLENLTLLEVHPVNVLVEGGMEALQVGEPKAAFFSRMFQPEKEVTSAVMFAVPMNAVLAAADIEVGESTFQMTLYDYSGTGKDPSDINNYLEGHNDKFRFGPISANQPWNAWDVEVGPSWNKTRQKVNIFRGIVAEEIDRNGYPKGEYLKENLFPSASMGNVIKRYPVQNPSGIFEKDTDGYYIYDSKTTPVKYHTFGSKKGTLEETDDRGHLNSTNGENTQEKLGGGFWPFGSTNFFHGMKFSFNFFLMADGMAENPRTNTKEEMIFEFQGDDDVWIYLTDMSDNSKSRLVLDVGGDHNSMNGTINFATGIVEYGRTFSSLFPDQPTHPAATGGTVVYGVQGSNRNNTEWYNTSPRAYLYTMEDWLEKHPGESARDFNKAFPLGAMNLPRKDLAQYRLDFYYLERGGKASNCYLKFNTPVVEKNKVSVAKKVVSDNPELLNGTYNFNLYMNGEEEPRECISVNVRNGYGIASSEEDYLLDETFILKEIDAKGAVKTEWTNLKNEVVTSPEDSLKTNSGTIGHEDDAVFLCTNYHDDLAPKISKKAIKETNRDGYYDLVLGVQGASTTITIEDKTDTYSTRNITAFDTLSSHVDFDMEQDWSGNHKPIIKLGSQRARVTNIPGENNAWNVYVNNKRIAEIHGKTITWYVTEENGTLDKNETKELHIAIKVTDPYKANYDDLADQDTGTHSGKYGYFSNVNETAKVTYYTTIPDSKQKELKFPKPVVRPADPNGTLKLTKNVVLDDSVKDSTIDPKFDFTITLRGILKDTVSVQYPNENVERRNVSNRSITLSDVKLGDKESIVITGLNQGVEYTIEENAYTDDFYTSVVQGGNTRKEGTLESDNARESVMYTNIVSAKPTMTLEKKVEVAKDYGSDPNETYEFVLENVNGNIAEAVKSNFAVYKFNGDAKEKVELDRNGHFSIIGEGKLLLVFEENFNEEAQYRIREVNAGTANATSWKIDIDQSQDGVTTDAFTIDGQNVIFTNRYDNHTLTIEKKLSENSYKPGSEEAKTFKFKVKFTGKDGRPLTNVGYDVSQNVGVTFDPEVAENGIITLARDGSVSFNLIAGNKLVLNKIPTGTTYTVEEIGWANENVNLAYYESTLVKVEKKNGTVVKEVTNPVTDIFETAVRAQNVIFTNEIYANMGTLQIVKQLEKKDNVSNAFRFKIEQMNGNDVVMTFYKTIVVPAGEKTAETEKIKVPAGTYKITELDTMKYECVETTEKSVEVTYGQNASVTFTNRKTTNQYFTDTNIKVNKVTGDGEGGFKYKDADKLNENTDEQPASLPVNSSTGSGEPKALPSDKEKEDDNDIV